MMQLEPSTEMRKTRILEWQLLRRELAVLLLIAKTSGVYSQMWTLGIPRHTNPFVKPLSELASGSLVHDSLFPIWWSLDTDYTVIGLLQKLFQSISGNQLRKYLNERVPAVDWQSITVSVQMLRECYVYREPAITNEERRLVQSQSKPKVKRFRSSTIPSYSQIGKKKSPFYLK